MPNPLDRDLHENKQSLSGASALSFVFYIVQTEGGVSANKQRARDSSVRSESRAMKHPS
jgi:hypothetical protein